MPGRGAAAAAENARPQAGKAGRPVGKFLRTKGKDSDTVSQFGQTGIGFRHHRTGADLQQITHHPFHLLGTKAAIGAHHVHAKVLHGFGKDDGRRAGKAHPLLKGHGNHDRQIADLTGRHHGGPCLGQIELRFNEDQVAAAGHQASDLGGKGRYIAQGAGKMPGGADVAGHPDGPRGSGSGSAGDLHHALAEGKDIQIGGQLERIAAKGAGSEDIHPGFHIGAMDTLQDIRPLHAEGFRADAQGKARGLEHGAHGTVQQQGAPLLKPRQKRIRWHECMSFSSKK